MYRPSLIIALVAVGLGHQDVPGQSGTRIYTQPRSGATVQQGSSSQGQVIPRESFESKFWRYLKAAQYTNWAPVPGKTDDTYPGKSPHGAFLRMYLNRKAAGRPSEMPASSVIVKENYGPDQRTLMAITVMYRSPGFHPAGGDWYWIKYNPNGTVASKDGMRLAGRVQGCIDCHAGAAGGDFVFAND